ncbi:hypothetical protein Tsp_01782 [Trichinella spiralis]|uniref:hypothetical protein n=1 Tax=Trichinella spiralis TaxID=6334 RepID=UPI0001EFCC96|nr:hypothetical protein Tsp_01782 [Trichinella spiralis]
MSPTCGSFLSFLHFPLLGRVTRYSLFQCVQRCSTSFAGIAITSAIASDCYRLPDALSRSGSGDNSFSIKKYAGVNAKSLSAQSLMIIKDKLLRDNEKKEYSICSALRSE